MIGEGGVYGDSVGRRLYQGRIYSLERVGRDRVERWLTLLHRSGIFAHCKMYFCQFAPEAQENFTILSSKYHYRTGIILACAMCAMAHRFPTWRIEIFFDAP